MIRSPVNTRNANGFFPRTADLPASMTADMANPSGIILGFVCENTDVGTIADDGSPEVSIIYKHMTPMTNAIWFFAETGERGIVNVISVPIHDHSSVIQGGPAYGTYFDDDILRSTT